MKDKGISLVELLIVITIINIIAISTAFSFRGWMGKYKIESQIKDLYVELMDARLSAIENKRTHFVRLQDATSYTFYEDDSNGAVKVPDGDGVLQTGSGASADTELPSFPKDVEYDFDWNNSSIAMPVDFSFNTRGISSVQAVISTYLDRDSDGEQDAIPDYDCISIRATRINLGKLETNDTSNRADDECIIK
ncbi:MAG: prepilin-type N-terminal cleavage/methylation domain-containing protein [Nitrospiraceae bacterium]|nr:MAG: prepilin-type N-terminal cleavage/methylation domain-containing protein [Nitrospiraceae bacterium]